MIKVVCFDLDGVFFINAHKNVAENFARKYGLDPEFLKEVLFTRAAEEGGYNKLKLGKIDPESYWSWLFDTLGLRGRATKQDYLETLLEGYEINQRAVELIDRLRAQGIKTAICSNNYEDNINMLQKRFNLEKYFDVMIFSYEVGVMKPDTRIYQALVDRAEVPPGEIVIADDVEEKLTGAKELGIVTFLYEDIDQFVAKLRELGLQV